MRILILGGDGMLGHQLLQHFQTDYVVRVTLRRDLAVYRDAGLFDSDNAYAGVDVRSTDRLIEVVADFQPEAVINAVGIVKQRKLVNESIPSLEINALFPHRLAMICKRNGARLVHVSTDCVFSGRKGATRSRMSQTPWTFTAGASFWAKFMIRIVLHSGRQSSG